MAQAPSDPPLQELRWLDPNAAATALTEVPRRHLAIEASGGKASILVRLGELAFRAPRILGGEARLSGLSCQTCHPNGDAATTFFVQKVSDRPGNVDVTHRLFNALTDDGLANPVNIPSLRGIALTAPYGRDGRIASLREFTRQVIVTEFDGGEPAGWLLDALVAYQQQLGFLPGAQIGPGGWLRAGENPAVRRGEAIFFRRFPNQPEQSCAGCHSPSANFVDGRQHDVGTGGSFDTPTLRNSVATAPYFHDGRYADLNAVVEHFDRLFELALTGADRRDLVAYLEAVGKIDAPMMRLRLKNELRRLVAFLRIVDYAARQEDARIGVFAAEAIRFELGRIYQRLPHPEGVAARRVLLDLSQELRRLVALFEDGAFIRVRDGLQKRVRLDDATLGQLAGAEKDSFYDPKRLEAAIGRR